MWIKTQPVGGQHHVYNSDFIQYLWTGYANELETIVYASLKDGKEAELGRYPETQLDTVIHQIMLAFNHQKPTFVMPNSVLEKEVNTI